MTDRKENATPVGERCVTSYPARRKYKPGVVFPPAVPGVAGSIDLHCHAHEGQQDAFSLAKLASESGMRGILFKTLGPISGSYEPMQVLRSLHERLSRWEGETGKEAVECWAGYGITMDNKPPSLGKLEKNLDEGVRGVWLPVFNHANTWNKVGGRTAWLNPPGEPGGHTEPLPWEEALRVGHYMLEGGKLKPFYADVVRMVADRDVALFFGHATHPEIWALAELVEKLGFSKAVIDHPFSPFVDLTVAQMRELSKARITFNFTYDEISPLLGVDPKRIYDAIREVGVQHCTLSSDAGEPLFPHTVECMRLIRGYMEAFGLSDAELRAVCCDNPARIAGAG